MNPLPPPPNRLRSGRYAPRGHAWLSCEWIEILKVWLSYKHPDFCVFVLDRKTKNIDPGSVAFANSHIQKVSTTFQEIVADVMVSCIGQLHVPKTPAFEGQVDFKGDAFHSAEWKKGYDLAGKRVGVIGTGASAVQIVPTIASKVSSRIEGFPQWGAIQYKGNQSFFAHFVTTSTNSERHCSMGPAPLN